MWLLWTWNMKLIEFHIWFNTSLPSLTFSCLLKTKSVLEKTKRLPDKIKYFRLGKDFRARIGTLLKYDFLELTKFFHTLSKQYSDNVTKPYFGRIRGKFARPS